MGLKSLKWAAAAVALSVAATAAPMTPASAEGSQFLPLLVYRTGPYAPSGTPLADGFEDYYNYVNEKLGGVGGVKLSWEECETEYNTDKGVECYERLKGGGSTGATVINPYSTGITYALIGRATHDKIPILSMGYGRADASDGSVFPYVFTAPITYWAGADVMVQYAKGQEGGSLQGKKIALVYHDSAYGKEPISTLERLAKQEGFELSTFPVAHPGLEQKATWLRIGRQVRPDYVFMWGWGVMNATAVKEAASVGFPMDHFIGIWWSGAEADVLPAKDAAKGYKSLNMTGVGTDFPIMQELIALKDAGKGATDGANLGTVLYNRGVVNGFFVTEAIRTAQEKYGKRPLTGEEVQWGFDHLVITEERLAETGFTGMVGPIALSCANHEGGGSALVQQWDGTKWQAITDFIDPNRDELWPAYEASADQYAKENGITPRNCDENQ